jgi:hypothetical protein
VQERLSSRAVAAVLVLTGIGLLSGFGLIGKFIIG